MSPKEFEAILDQLVSQLRETAREQIFRTSKQFEDAVREGLETIFAPYGLKVKADHHPQDFPDVALGEFGVEVKFTENDQWRSIANSVLERRKNDLVRHIYLVFGKMGGEPDVRWGRYEDCVVHVRTSHVPRFEVEIGTTNSLFSRLGISYNEFSQLSMPEKMVYLRQYARRPENKEYIWWLDDHLEEIHDLPKNVRRYTQLSGEEKKELRGEAALLCPEVLGKDRDKYDKVAFYCLIHRAVICTGRDLFTAGSITGGQDTGGDYLKKGLVLVQEHMVRAAQNLEEGLFQEYWGYSVPPDERIYEWLRRADQLAHGWVPSDVLFKAENI
jgi:hypothetical protein